MSVSVARSDIVICVASLGFLILAGGGCTYDFRDTGGAGGQSTSTSETANGTTVDVATTDAGPGTGAGGAGNCDPLDPNACDDANVCTTDSCTAGQCMHVAVRDGLAPGYVDTPTDCVDDVCKEGALLKNTPDDTEVPDDMNVCTIDSCSGGMPSHTADLNLVGMSCGVNQVCDDNGSCVGCLTAADCAGADTFCEARTCSAAHICGVMNLNEGVALPTGQTAQDCKSILCVNGVPSSVDADDPMDDGNACTSDTCVNGANVHQNLGPSTPCGVAAFCKDAFNFKPQNHCLAGMCFFVTAYACPSNYSCTHNQCNTSCGNNNQCAPGFTCDLVNNTCQ